MEQTFNDLCRERAGAGGGLASFVLWAVTETSAGILRENLAFILMQTITRRMLVWATLVALLLVVPLLGKASWTLFDFVVAGTLLYGSTLIYELIARKGGTTAYRAAVGIACATGLLLVWINLAVGVIGSEDNPANLMYFGVLAVGFLGVFLARFQPRGMARALLATALAQLLVPIIAVIIWRPDFNPGVVQVFILNAFFAALWGVSALLFRYATASGPMGDERGTSAGSKAIID